MKHIKFTHIKSDYKKHFQAIEKLAKSLPYIMTAYLWLWPFTREKQKTTFYQIKL